MATSEEMIDCSENSPDCETLERRPRRQFSALFLLIVFSHTCLLVYSATVHSPNANEPAHLVAGLSHLEDGTFELYRVNPPLIRVVAAVPAWIQGYRPDWRSWTDHPQSRPVFRIGMDFFDDHGSEAFQLVFLGRLCCIPFSWLGACVCYRWAAELYGDRAGIIATALWCFSPGILAHAAFMTPDAGAAACGVAACYLFWKWQRSYRWTSALAAGSMLGVALLTKSTWIVLLGLWPLIWGIQAFQSTSRHGGRVTGTQLAQLVLMLVTGLHVLNMGYLYNGTFTRLSDFRFTSQPLAAGDLSQLPEGWGNRFQDTVAGQIPMPLPRDYVTGIDVQKRDFERGRLTYFRRQWYNHGFWYYYVYALAVKLPVGLMLLAIMALFSRLRTVVSGRELALTVPPLGVFLLVSQADEWNAHSRYVLLCFPFAFIWVSQAVAAVRATAGFRFLFRSSFVLFLASSFWCFPHSLSYFNELVCGPVHGDHHLLDSNVDWGQDLSYLEDWAARHPEQPPFTVVYYGLLNPGITSEQFLLPAPRPDSASPFTPTPGLYAVSTCMLHGLEFWGYDESGSRYWNPPETWSALSDYHEVARVGYGFRLIQVGNPSGRCESDAAAPGGGD